MYTSYVTLTSAIAVLVCAVLVYRHFTDPLRAIPGPFLAKLTGAWVVILDLTGNRATTLHELHKKHGHVVRVAPDQLTFASPRALKDIYGTNSGFAKARVYETMGFRSTFTTIDRDEYRMMKKRILPSFSPAFVDGLEPTVQRQAANLIKCIDKRLGAPMDVMPWFRMFALGVVGEGFAGTSFGGLETEQIPQLLHDIDDVFPGLWVKWMFPAVTNVLMRSPLRGIRSFLEAPTRFKQYCTNAYQQYLAEHDVKTRNDLIARLYNEQVNLAEKGQPIPFHVTDDGIVQEVTNLLFAGTDTTSNTLSYLFWELSHHPEWQQRLREGLRQACGDKPSPTYAELSEVAILDAVVYELLRLWPAAPCSLPRIVPKGGAVIDGVFVPENITVSCQAYSEHRDPNIFPNPDVYSPQRWLDADKEAKEAMHEQIFLFGKGARACLGRRIAFMEIKVSVAAMVRHFNVDIGSETTDADMAITDHFVLIPKGGKCILQFTKA